MIQMQMSGDECKRIVWQAAIWLALLRRPIAEAAIGHSGVAGKITTLHGEFFLNVAAQVPELLDALILHLSFLTASNTQQIVAGTPASQRVRLC